MKHAYLKKYHLLSSLFLAAAALAAGPASAAGDSTPAYLDPQQIDLTVLLAPPPAMDSARQQADLAQVLEVQRTRTPEQVERARADVQESVFRFADVLGPEFTEANLPKTAALFTAVAHDAALVAARAKHSFNRPRPFVNNSEVHPTVSSKPKSNYNSYPSGHATLGYIAAILLSQMVPEKRDALFARGREYGENRVVDGMHYPDDVEAGRINGTLVANALMSNPAFERDFAAAKAELRATLRLN